MAGSFKEPSPFDRLPSFVSATKNISALFRVVKKMSDDSDDGERAEGEQERLVGA